MKSALALTLLAALCAPLPAQHFRPAAVNGAIIGGIAGAVIGHNSHHRNAWAGAALGATTGLLIGSAIDQDRHGGHRSYGHYEPRHPAYVPLRRHDHFYGHRGWYSPSFSYVAPAPVVVYSPYSRPSHASRGLFWGGLAGAIIGHNSGHHRHHNTWRGAAIGATAGVVLGSILDSRYYYRPAPVLVERPPVVIQDSSSDTVPAPQAAPQNVTIINNYYAAPATPMSAANTMFGR